MHAEIDPPRASMGRRPSVAANQDGVALVLVLLVLSLLTITIVEFAYSSLVYSHLSRNAVNGLQANLLARSGLNFGEAALVQDADNQVDSFQEEWCPEPGPTWCRIDESLLQLPRNMRLRIQIFDEGGKLNINLTRPRNVQEYTQVQADPDRPVAFRVAQVALQTLIEGVGGDPAAAERLAEHWGRIIEEVAQSQPAAPQAGSVPTPGQGQAAQGSTNQSAQSHQAALLNQYNFPTLDDANDVLRLDPRVLQRLRRYVTANNTQGPGRLNVNTAPREVLQAVLNDPGAVDSIIFQRETAPIQRNDITSMVSTDTTGDPFANIRRGLLGAQSDLFRIYASAIINPDPLTGEGGLARTASMVVRRMNVGATAANNGLPRWTLTRLDWQKEGGAVLFQEETQQPGQEPGAAEDDRASF